MNNNFYNPGNLDNDSFKPAGDLESAESNNFKFTESKTMSVDEIKSYIASFQTRTRTSGLTSGGGCIMATFDRFKDMVNDGYNIIRAGYFEQMGMIEVEFDVPVQHKTK